MFIVYLIQSYFDFILSLVEMQNIFFFVVYTVLLYDNFKFTEMLYTFMIEEGFNRSSTYIEAGRDFV